MSLRIDTISVGALSENCYLLWKRWSKQALLIDPGAEAYRIQKALEEHSLTPVGILLTHAHIDHIGALPTLAKAFPDCPIWLDAKDHPLYFSPKNALPPWAPGVSSLPQPQTDNPPQLPSPLYQILPTPGHTPGGSCFYFPEEKVIFTGDTLFAGAVGRTDLGGNEEELRHSLHEVLFQLPDNITVYPGHGPATTIGDEKMISY